jgi:hypothetical protein
MFTTVGWIVTLLAIAAVVNKLWFIIFPFLLLTLAVWLKKTFPQLFDIIDKTLASFFQWLGGKIPLVIETVKKGYQFLKEKVRGIGSTYVQTGANTVKATREVLIDIGNGQGKKYTQEEELPWEDLPGEIRGGIIQHPEEVVTVNESDVIDSQLQQRAKEENVPELLTLVQKG